MPVHRTISRRPGLFLSISFLAILCTSPADALGPENLLVLVNRTQPGDLAIANRYRSARGVPDRNFLYLDYTGGFRELPFAEFDQKIRQPALEYLKKSGLEGTISVWATTPSFPYRIGANSLSASIFFGKELPPIASAALGPGGYAENSPYFDLRQGVEPPTAGKPARYLHMAMDAGNIDATLKMIDRSARADGKKPKGTVYLIDGIGPRSSRMMSIPFAQRLLDLLGVKAEHLEGGHVGDRDNVLGIYVGNVNFPVTQNRYVAGALGDHLTSAGGFLRDPIEGQMLCWDFLSGGCSATYGTVIEPFNYWQKFPSAQLYVFYASGLSAVESYWMSVAWPHQGLFLGDPLTRPFGSPPRVRFVSPPPAESKGVIECSAVADVQDEGPGVSKVDLYLDGRRISRYDASGLPVGASATVATNDKTVTATVEAGQSLVDFSTRLRKRLMDEGKWNAMPSAPDLILFRGATRDFPAIECATSTPILFARPIRPEVLAGSSTPVSVYWNLQGTAEPGDIIALEIQENQQRTALMTFDVQETTPAESLAQSLARVFRLRVPSSYRVNAGPPSGQADNATLGLAAVESKTGNFPYAALILKATPKSALKISYQNKLVPLTDTTMKAYDLAWIRMGVGESEVHVKASIPTQKLLDGRHVLRVVAERGTASKESSWIETSFVVDNNPGRMRLSSLRDQASLSAMEPLLAARVVFEEEENGPVQFLVDGQPALMKDASPFEFAIDPKQWGVGRHQITAKKVASGKAVLLSDQAVNLEIVP